jgi:DNA-directed RNA polymerase subunit RPC12/RpoP
MVVLGLYLSGGGIMTVKTHQPEQVITCPHCGYSVRASVRSLQRRPLRRCPRCGRGHVPSAQTAQTVDAETLADARELLEQLHAIQRDSAEFREVILQLEELIEVVDKGGSSRTALRSRLGP